MCPSPGLSEEHRALAMRHIAQCKTHIILGEKHIAKQLRLISELERDGHDVGEAKALLAQFEQYQRLHCERFDTLLGQLSDADRAEVGRRPSRQHIPTQID